MLYRTVISSFLIAAAFAFSPSTPAQASGIEGQVRGVDGRPLQNAQVRIERKDKAGAPVTMQTNAKGSYSIECAAGWHIQSQCRRKRCSQIQCHYQNGGKYGTG